MTIPYLEICWQIIHLKRFQFFNGRWVKSQRSVTFPTQDLEPLRYTVENGNGNSQNQNGAMQVEDIELRQPSLKRQLTPPTEMDSQPPAKRSVLEGEVKGEITTDEDGVDGDASEACEDGDTVREADEDGEGGEAEQPTSVDMTETGELLPNNIPKIYDLFATCVSASPSLVATQ